MTLLLPGEAAVVPGLMMLGPGVERYRVTGGGATVLALDAGDELEIVDPEGCQPCELVAFDTGGQSDPGLLEVTNGGAAAFAPADPAAVGILSAPLTDARRTGRSRACRRRHARPAGSDPAEAARRRHAGERHGPGDSAR